MTTTTTAPPPIAQPALSVQRLRELIAAGRIDQVILAVPGPTGLRGKVLDARFFLSEVLEHGAHASAYLLTADPDMRVLPDFTLGGWEHGAGDVLLRADSAALYPAGWAPGAALVLADALDAGGHAIAFAPRTVLARQVRQLDELGLTASMGLEAEALAFDVTGRQARRRGYRALPPATEVNGDYALHHDKDFARLLAALRIAARDSGLPLEAVKAEAGHGQIEVTLRHGDPLAAADRHVVFKLLARAIAQREGMTLTFMAKPYSGVDGNSCHLHLSLRTADGDVLVDQSGLLTRLGQHAVAGALAVLRDLTVLMLPYVNSYKRIHADPPLFAPSTLTWGYDNRTTAIRVVGRGAGGHLECRIPGADAQPHLAAAALLAACAHGISHELPLDADPVSGNAYQLVTAPRLPTSLQEATSLFAASTLAAQLLGPDVVAHYATAACHESSFHRAAVTDVERERGFDQA